MGRMSDKAFGGDLFSPPPQAQGEAYARRTDPGTSHAAAKSVEPVANSIEKIVSDAVISSGITGMICDEIVAKTGLHWNTVSPRLAPLARQKIIKAKTMHLADKPLTRKGQSGRAQTVWIGYGV